MRNLVFGLTVLAAAVAINACGDDEGEGEGGVDITAPSGCEVKMKGEVYIAGLFPYSIVAAGVHWEKAVILAAEQINAGGGIDGKSLGLLVCDTQGEKSVGVQLATEVGGMEHVAAIIGAGRSAVTLGDSVDDIGVCKAGANAGIVSISPGSTNPAIGDIADDGFCFRTCVSDAVQGAAWYHLMKALGKTTPYVVYDAADSYTIGLADAFRAKADVDSGVSAGGDGYDIDADDFAGLVVAAAAAHNADVIMLSVFGEASAKIADAWSAHDWGGNAPIFIGGDGVPMMVDYVAGSAWGNGLNNNIYTTYPGYPTADTAAFAAKYKTRWGHEWEAFDHSTYDAVYLISMAMTLSSDPADKASLKSNLSKTSSGTAVKFSDGWDSILSTLKADGEADYVGAGGAQDFDSKGDVQQNIGVKIGADGSFSSYDAHDCFNIDGSC